MKIRILEYTITNLLKLKWMQQKWDFSKKLSIKREKIQIEENKRKLNITLIEVKNRREAAGILRSSIEKIRRKNNQKGLRSQNNIVNWRRESKSRKATITSTEEKNSEAAKILRSSIEKARRKNSQKSIQSKDKRTMRKMEIQKILERCN